MSGHGSLRNSGQVQDRGLSADVVSMMFVFFLILQLADLATTMVGLRLGAQEASPLARGAMYVGVSPATGVLATKLAAVVIAGVCVWTRRARVIGWVNYWYVGLVLWNIGIIARLGA
jgi:hypothetical protein